MVERQAEDIAWGLAEKQEEVMQLEDWQKTGRGHSLRIGREARREHRLRNDREAGRGHNLRNGREAGRGWGLAEKLGRGHSLRNNLGKSGRTQRRRGRDWN
jgi:hypothetical protein